MTTGLTSRAEAISTTVLADMVRDAGYPNQVVAPHIQAIGRSVPRAGWAYTIGGGAPEPGESGPDFAKARAIDEMSPDQIAIWAGGDVSDVCLFGGLLAGAMAERGVRGAVVDGGVRDVEDFESTGFLVHARYVTPKASTGFWRVRQIQQPVTLPGAGPEVTVSPGDLVVADRNGVVVIPRRAVTLVVAAGEAHVRREAEVRGRIEAGESLEGLLRTYGRI